MKIERNGDTMRVSDIAEINAINAASFRDEVRATIEREPMAELEIDLSQTRFVDESGLGALFAIYKIARNKDEGIHIRLTSPRPSIRQLFALTQLDQLFEVVAR